MTHQKPPPLDEALRELLSEDAVAPSVAVDLQQQLWLRIHHSMQRPWWRKPTAWGAGAIVVGLSAGLALWRGHALAPPTAPTTTPSIINTPPEHNTLETHDPGAPSPIDTGNNTSNIDSGSNTIRTSDTARAPVTPKRLQLRPQPSVGATDHGAESPPTRPDSDDAGATLLLTARRALQRGELDEAMAQLSLHQARYPNSPLQEERDALFVLLAWRQQASDAAAQTERFFHRYPQSIFTETLVQARDGSAGRTPIR